MVDAPRPITLVGLATPPTGQYAAGWMHPDARNDWLDAAYWVDTARALEAGGFDLLFLPDALAVPEDREGGIHTTLETGGKGALYLDPVVTLASVAGATSSIGLGATVSTSFAPPYLIARSLLTLDHLSGGRCAWNIVTSTTDAEARNLGREGIAPKAERYDRADRVVDEVIDLMRSWEPGALLLDTERGRFADPARVHRSARGGEVADGDGRRRAPGPLTMPRSRQDHPVLMQAGASERGLEFAARWAEIAFVWAEDREAAVATRTDLRRRAAAHGRDPDGLRVCVGVQPIAAASDEAARMLVRDLEDRLDPALTMRALARIFHADPASIDPAEPATAFLDRHRGATGAEGFERMLRRRCEREGLTVGRFAILQSMHQLAPQFVGGGASIADELCAWVDAGACDGFVVSAAVQPTSLVAFAEHVGPELRRRRRLHGAATPAPAGQPRTTLRTILRERLGIAAPAAPGVPGARSRAE